MNCLLGRARRGWPVNLKSPSFIVGIQLDGTFHTYLIELINERIDLKRGEKGEMRWSVTLALIHYACLIVDKSLMRDTLLV